MADTIRNEAALQALLADNTAGDISAQDVRDLLVSVPTLAITAGNASSQRTALGLGTMATAAAADYAALAGATFTGAVTVGNGTITANTPALALTQTWNNSGVVFKGFTMNITTTAADNSSLAMEVTVGGTLRMSLDRYGLFLVDTLRAGSTTQSWFNANATAAALRSNGYFAFTSSATSATAAIDTALYRNAAGVIEINNGTAGTYRDLIVRHLTSSVGTITSTAGTITASTPILSATQTWNSSGVAFQGIVVNVTNTSSDSASRLLNLQIGGTSVFYVDRDGLTQAAGMDVTISGSRYARYLGSRVEAGATLYWAWSDTNNNANATKDTGFARNAAGVMEINSGTVGTYRDLRARNVRTEPVAVASLVAAATAGKGARAFVTDANAATFGTTVAGGGANNVPCYSDGTNWIIG